MRQCNSCQFENADDARVCARCSAALARGNGESSADASDRSEPALPAWMQSMQRAGERQLVGSATNGMAAGALATVASLPVQVRRSRGPLLTVGIGAGAAPASAAGVADAGVSLPATSDLASGRAGSSRLRLILLIIIVLAALTYLILRFGI